MLPDLTLKVETMLQYLICLILLSTLAGCLRPAGPNFARMSDEELAAYNASVSAGDMVYCFEEVRLGSHMTKRHCATSNELSGELESGIQTLGVINADSNIGPGTAVYPGP